jgi:hypothetical protein
MSTVFMTSIIGGKTPMLKLNAPPSIQLFIAFSSALVQTIEQINPRGSFMSVRSAPSRIIFEWRINVEGESWPAIITTMSTRLATAVNVYTSWANKLSQGGFRLYSAAMEPINMKLIMEIMVDKEWRLINLCEEFDNRQVTEMLDGLLPFLEMNRRRT